MNPSNSRDIDTPLPRKMIRIRRVSAITDMAPSTIYAKIAKGDFPPGKKYSSGKGGARRWDEAEILSWLDGVSA